MQSFIYWPQKLRHRSAPIFPLDFEKERNEL